MNIGNLLYTLICIAIVWHFASCSNKKCITHKYDNGAILAIICYDSEKLKNGKYLEYHNSGNLSIDCSFYKDSLDGEYIEHHPNGQLRYRMNYDKNRLMNISNYQDEDGNLMIIGDFNNGNGILNVYNHKGKLRRFGRYIDGLKTGYWKLVSNSGVSDSVMYQGGYRVSTGRYEFTP